MTQRLPPDQPKFSMLRGMWFVFRSEGQRFAVWVSSFSGKEEVYWNDKLVATRRKISLSSTHKVVANQVEYTIHLATRELRKGKFECTLAQSGIVIQGWETEYIRGKSFKARAIAIAASSAFTLLWLNSQLTLLGFGAGLLAIIGASTVWWSTYGKGFIIREMHLPKVAEA